MLGLDFKEIVTIGMVLFAVIDIVGTIPIIVELRQKFGHIESEKASLVAGVIMIVFLFVGEELLKHITTNFDLYKLYSDNKEFKEDFSSMMFGVVKELINRGINAQK